MQRSVRYRIQVSHYRGSFEVQVRVRVRVRSGVRIVYQNRHKPKFHLTRHVTSRHGTTRRYDMSRVSSRACSNMADDDEEASSARV